VELPLVDLGQVGENVGERAALLRQVRLQSVDDFAVQEMLQREAIHRPSPSKPGEIGGLEGAGTLSLYHEEIRRSQIDGERKTDPATATLLAKPRRVRMRATLAR
jgi:hypothetical protein